jgi:RNA polymerase sigma-70 factor (ECF subfamily)
MPDEVFDVTDCLARVLAGDQAAGCRLVAHLHPLALRIARANGSQSRSDDDLTQEVFLTMFARLDRYRPFDGIPFAHWFARLAVNVCRDVLRAEGRRPMHVALSPAAEAWLGHLAGAGETPNDSDVDAARELVDRLLAELPPDDRLVLTLLDLEQRSTAEIAQMTGWSRTLVKVRAFRARRRLRAVAERLDPGRKS